MPLVRIDMLEGRPREKLGELHGRVSALVAEILETPVERVRTIITEPVRWPRAVGPPTASSRRRARVAAVGRPAPARWVRGAPGGRVARA
jgi:4-oxalocrotonate tautomerase